MQRALSTLAFAQHRLTTVTLERISRAGIPLVEIYCARQHFDYRDRAQIAEMGHWFRDADVKLQSLHAPVYSDDVGGRSGPQAHVNLAETIKARRIEQVDEIKRTIEIAETVPFQYLVQHLGMPGEEFGERKIDAAFSSLEELSVFAKHRGVEVLLENTANGLSTAERLNLFFDTTHMNLNVCFDIGHAHLTGSIDTEFRALKPRIRSVNVHDNNGKDDGHLFPLLTGSAGTIDWRATMELLRSAPGQFPLLLEVKEAAEMAQPLEAVCRTFDRLEELRD